MDGTADPAARPAPLLTPAPRLGLRESVFEAVKGLLMDNRLEPGARVSIDGLARDLQVSPTPVREALFRCEAEGLVVRRPNAGYTVAPLLDREGLQDLFDVRLLLEPAAAARAAVRAGPEERAEIRAVVAAMRPVAGEDYAAYRGSAELDARLHAAIARASGSRLIAETLDRLRAHTHVFRLHFRHGFDREAATEHRAIEEAVGSGAAEDAEEAMRAHLLASRTRLLAAYDPPGDREPAP